MTLVSVANLLWKSTAKTNLSPQLSPNLFVVCVCKGTPPEWSSWKRSCQRPAGCWPSRKPRSCPSRERTGRLTHTRRWLSSELSSLKDLADKGKQCLPEMNFCPLPVVRFFCYTVFTDLFSASYLSSIMDLCQWWCPLNAEWRLLIVSASHFIFKDRSVYLLWTVVWLQITPFAVM